MGGLAPVPIAGRHAQTMTTILRRLTKLETRTGSIDSGYPLATLPAQIDPSYSGSGNPHAYINGSSTLTGPYAFLGTYKPVAGQAVYVQPVGAQQAYVITGSTTPPAATGVSTAWQSVAYVNGFSGNVEYRFLDSAGLSVQVTGQLTLPGGSVTYNFVEWASLPTAYQPSATRNWPVVPLSGSVTSNPSFPGWPHAIAEPGGVLYVYAIPGTENGQGVDVSGIFAL
jgi:hypothetical protein